MKYFRSAFFLFFFLFFWSLWRNCQSFDFRWPAGHQSLIPGISRIFVKFPNILSFKTFANLNNLFLVIIIQFRFIFGESFQNMTMSPNILFEDVWEISFYSLILWKCMRTSKIKEFNKKVKNLKEYTHDSIWAAFTTKNEIQKQCFSKYSKFDCLSELNYFNINFNSERGFQIIKICRNCKFQGVWAKLKIN